MRITARQLRQIIKEEVENMMSEEDAAVATDSLKDASNFSIDYEFKNEGLADFFLRDQGLSDVKSGKLEFTIFKNNAGELRAVTKRFVSDTGKPLLLGFLYSDVNSMTRPDVTTRGVRAPAGATVGLKIEIPVNVSVRQMGKSVDFKFTAI
jgi:hypothetical protein